MVAKTVCIPRLSHPSSQARAVPQLAGSVRPGQAEVLWEERRRCLGERCRSESRSNRESRGPPLPERGLHSDGSGLGRGLERGGGGAGGRATRQHVQDMLGGIHG